VLLRVVMVALAAALMAFYGRPRFGPESFAGRSLAEIEQPRRDCPSGTQESPSTGECVPSAPDSAPGVGGLLGGILGDGGLL
jgi:hypothetical protein